jgi:hypothetical protein
MRSELPDDVAITFTHGDLHRSNIIVSLEEGSSSRPRHYRLASVRLASGILGVLQGSLDYVDREEWEVEYLPRFWNRTSGMITGTSSYSDSAFKADVSGLCTPSGASS